MAYISNKERAKKAKKLTKGFGWQKFVIAIAAILSAVVVLAAIFLFVAPYFNIADDGSINAILFDSNGGLTTWGWVVVGVFGGIVVFDILAFILVFTMTSSKKTMQEAKELIAAPKPGKKGSTKVVLEKVEANTLSKPKK